MFCLDFVFLHSLAHGCPFGGCEAGFASSFIIRMFCEHGHGSMLLAGSGYGPASNKWMRPVVQLLLRVATCWLSILRCHLAVQCFGSKSGEIRNAARQAPRRSIGGGPRQREFPGASVAGSLSFCRSRRQKLLKRRGRVCCAGS